MTNDQAFDAVFGRSRGSSPGWLPNTSQLPPLNPFEPSCRDPEPIASAREYVELLNANSGEFGENAEREVIPTEDMVGEEAVDEFGMPGPFCAATYGLLIEPYELRAMLGDQRREPAGRTFAVYPVNPTGDCGFIGLLVEYAPSGQWSLLVSDFNDASRARPGGSPATA